MAAAADDEHRAAGERAVRRQRVAVQRQALAAGDEQDERLDAAVVERPGGAPGERELGLLRPRRAQRRAGGGGGVGAERAVAVELAPAAARSGRRAAARRRRARRRAAGRCRARARRARSAAPTTAACAAAARPGASSSAASRGASIADVRTSSASRPTVTSRIASSASCTTWTRAPHRYQARLAGSRSTIASSPWASRTASTRSRFSLRSLIGGARYGRARGAAARRETGRPGRGAGRSCGGSRRPAWHHVGVAYRELPPPPDLAHVVRCLLGADGDGRGDARAARRLPRRDRPRRPRGAWPGRTPGRSRRPWPHGAVIARRAPAPGRGRRRARRAGRRAARPARPARRAVGPRRCARSAERAGGDPAALAAALRAAPAAPRRPTRACSRRRAGSPARRRPRFRCSPARSGLGERQLRRRFAAAVGYGPKTFARVARFRDRRSALVRAGAPLAAAAAEAGYADQAHMTREIAGLAGRTPALLRAA